MFEFFSAKKHHFVGIDFGTSAIKVVELSFDGQKINLENYGWVDLDMALQAEDDIATQTLSYEDRMKKHVKSLLDQMGVTEKNAYVAIPGFSGLITLVEFPEMNSEELEKAIHFESHKYIPTAVEEIAMSWEIVGKREAEEANQNDGSIAGAKKLQVLLVAAPKKEIAKYERLMSESGLEITAIELETFSIVRTALDENTGNVIIVDIGARATNILLVENGIVKVNRNVDAGGSEVTKTISESMNISKQRAESFKQGEKDLLNGKEAAITMPVLEMIVSEIVRIITVYSSKNKDFKVGKMIISGGLSKMEGIDRYFSRTLGLEVKIVDPWRNIMCDEKLKPYIKQMGASFTVAVGLALRGIEDSKQK